MVCSDREYERWFCEGTLPVLCERLHMQNNGSADPWSAEDIASARSYLERRISEWVPRPSAYDSAVYFTILAILGELIKK